MSLTKDEKKLLRGLLKKNLKDFKAEGDTIIEYTFPQFKAGEEKYEAFLKGILKKLE